MPTFGLFSHDFTLTEGQNTFTKIGPFSVHASFTLRTAQNRLDGVLQGSVCGAVVDLSFQASIAIAGGRVRITAPPSGVTANQVSFPFSSTSPPMVLLNPELSVHEDERIGLAVRDRNERAFEWIGRSERLPGAVAVLGKGTGALVHLDVRSGRVVHRPIAPTKPSLSWQDVFSKEVGGELKQIGPVQPLDIARIWFDDTEYEIEARPRSGALFLHADLLDTIRLEKNEFLFQYAVANGLLRIRGKRETAEPRAFWSKDEDAAVDPAVVFLRLQDEHGLPIALVPAVDVPIAPRLGVDIPVREQSNAALWDLTNAAMVIGPHAANGAECSIPGRVRALDPLALYDAFADLDGAKNGFERPSFLAGGVAPLGGAPREVHGLSRGARLERRTDDADPPLPARLRVQGIPGGAPGGMAYAFHHTDLVLADSALWTLVALAEERDVAPRVDTAGSGVVGAYRFDGSAGELALPAADLHFALSNLAGPERRDVNGKTVGTGTLPKLGRDHLRDLETQFSGDNPTRFTVRGLGDQHHVGGARVVPPAAQPFARMLDDLPTSAADATETARPGPLLDTRSGSTAEVALTAEATSAVAAAPHRTQFVFGGDEQNAGLPAVLLAEANEARDKVGKVFRTFEQAWRQNATDARVVFLRKKLGIPTRPQALGDLDQAAELLVAALAYVAASDNIDDVTDDAEALLEYLEGLTAEDFAEFWSSAEPGLTPLLEHLFSPANNDLLRRVARFLSVPDPNDPADPLLATLLFGSNDIGDILGFLDGAAAGLLTDLQRGLDPLWEATVELWKEGKDAFLDQLRATYGPILSRDVYARLLDPSNAADAAKLVELIQTDLGKRLRNLGDLATDPPDYVFRTRRFPVQRSAAKDELVSSMWERCFDLCSFSDAAKDWTFFLDDDASVIVKLTQKRTLGDVLGEIVATYRSAARPDPLGLEQDVASFVATLDADLLATDWTGVLLLRPVADISRDLVLRDLTGFDHITASYVAIGGRRPASGAERLPDVDVWAHVFKQKPAGRDLDEPPETIGDVKLALTKFDVRIRQTQLSDADIEVEIYPQDVWGRKKQPPAPGTEDRREFEKIVLRGTLGPPSTKPGEPRDLVFSASFPRTFVIPIDLAFVKELALSALRVARRNGTTCIEIDGSLVLQDKVAGLDLDIDLVEPDTRLSLQDFRIQLPPLAGKKVEIGTLRKLAFDFPAVRIALPKPRAFNVFGVEMVPRGLGYIRGSQEALEKLKNDYVWLSRLDLGTSGQAGDVVSYVELDADFGKLPSFGLVDARGLRFRLVLAVKIHDGKQAEAAYLGIAGLDARELKIDLFRLLTVEMKRLRISPAKLLEKGEDPDHHPDPDAGAVLAEQIRLKILDWSLLPEKSRFDLLFLHPTRSPDASASGRKGMLCFYDANAALSTDPKNPDKPPEKKFFQIFWVLLAHNLELPSDVLSFLLDKKPTSTDPDGLLKRLLVKPPESENPDDPRLDLLLEGVKLLERESWLFGLSFKLGELFQFCSLIFHDQHYYGIHLGAKWVEAVFGQDSIELAYIPGGTRSADRFRTNLRIPALDMLGSMKSGEFALEWAVNWDFLVDVGYPWRTSIGYDWFRAFSVPVGVYEGKFGFYFEKRTVAVPDGEQLILSAGLGLYVGYYFGAGNSVAWVRAGIGVFAILQGTITFQAPGAILSPAILKATIKRAEIVGVVGIFAYGEGGVDVWILSARFRVSAQASLECRILLVAGGPCALSYAASLSAAYSASVRVGCGFFSWTFSVSGAVQMGISGQLLLS